MKRARKFVKIVRDENNLCFTLNPAYRDDTEWQRFKNNTNDRDEGMMRKDCILNAYKSTGYQRVPIKILIARIKDQGDYTPSGTTPIELCICWQLLSLIDQDNLNLIN